MILQYTTLYNTPLHYTIPQNAQVQQAGAGAAPGRPGRELPHVRPAQRTGSVCIVYVCTYSVYVYDMHGVGIHSTIYRTILSIVV